VTLSELQNDIDGSSVVSNDTKLMTKIEQDMSKKNAPLVRS
jgi:hypothetical protein